MSLYGLQVAAAKFEVPTDWTAPVHEKPDEAKQFLKDTMATNKLMKSLAPSDREELMHAFQKVRATHTTAWPLELSAPVVRAIRTCYLLLLLLPPPLPPPPPPPPPPLPLLPACLLLLAACLLLCLLLASCFACCLLAA